jgi:hypothetical protein
MVAMAQEKRMAENYEITNAFRIGDKEVVFGVDEHSENPFFCGFCERENLIVMVRERYTECKVGDDYIGILELFADRVKELTQKVRTEWAKITVSRDPITPDMCFPNDYNKSIEGQVVAIKKTVFRPEYQSADHQLAYVTGGNGAKGNPHGRACFCKNLYTGKENRYERYEIEGVVKPEHLPEWAQERLAEIQKQIQAEKQTQRREER